LTKILPPSVPAVVHSEDAKDAEDVGVTGDWTEKEERDLV